MFEPACRSFLVMFPTEKFLLEREAKKVCSIYCPDFKPAMGTLHLTFHYFNADLAACRRVAKAVDKMPVLPAPFQLTMESAFANYSEETHSASIGWNVTFDDHIYILREQFTPILKALDIDFDFEITWKPHIIIGTVPEEYFDKTKPPSAEIKPVKAVFKYLQLSRMTADQTFEIVDSWKLPGKGADSLKLKS